MSKGLKLFLQYVISLVFAIVLLWVVFKDVDIAQMLNRIKGANFNWVYLSIAIGFISHYSRTVRWQMLYEPLGYKPSMQRLFLALMSGYFINLIIPRLGEITRCGVIQKAEKIPLATSIGTVIAERIFDVAMLFVLFVSVFIIEFDRLSSFFISIFLEKFGQTEINKNLFIYILIFFALFLVSTVILLSVFKDYLKKNTIYLKAVNIGRNIWLGIASVRHVKNKKLFMLHTLNIWAMYFFMMYLCIYAIAETSGLSIMAGFSILLMGSIGMATPVQGGIGAFHLLVSKVLILYGVSENVGLDFAFLVHTSQYIITFVLGGACLLITLFLKQKVTKPIPEQSL